MRVWDLSGESLGDHGLPLMLAKNFTRIDPPSKPRKIDLIIVHDMEMPELKDTAERCARYFAQQPKDGALLPDGSTFKRASSCHYSVDAYEVIQSVLEKDVAWHAPGANHNGIGIEHAGYARYSAQDWRSEYEENVLLNSANLAGQICSAYNIPVEFVDENGLLAQRRGITTHACVSRAFKKSTHTDPGPNWPMSLYLELIRAGIFPSNDEGNPIA